MRELKFRKPIGLGKRFQTVRLGVRYDEVGEIVNLVDQEGNHYGQAEVVSALVSKFKNLDKSEISLEHDPRCRSLAGLYDELNRCYGYDFDMEADVTVLTVVPLRKTSGLAVWYFVLAMIGILAVATGLWLLLLKDFAG